MKTTSNLYQSQNEINPLKMFDRYQEQFLNELDDIKKPFNSLLKKTKLSKSIQMKNSKLDNDLNEDENY